MKAGMHERNFVPMHIQIYMLYLLPNVFYLVSEWIEYKICCMFQMCATFAGGDDRRRLCCSWWSG